MACKDKERHNEITYVGLRHPLKHWFLVLLGVCRCNVVLVRQIALQSFQRSKAIEYMYQHSSDVKGRTTRPVATGRVVWPLTSELKQSHNAQTVNNNCTTHKTLIIMIISQISKLTILNTFTGIVNLQCIMLLPVTCFAHVHFSGYSGLQCKSKK